MKRYLTLAITEAERISPTKYPFPGATAQLFRSIIHIILKYPDTREKCHGSHFFIRNFHKLSTNKALVTV